MIDSRILDRICPVPDEAEEMSSIREELEENGFVINNFRKGGIFYHIIRIFVRIYIELLTVAREQINNLFILHADEDWLEVKGADFGKARVPAIKAKGYVTIYRDEYDNAMKITKGHGFKTPPDVNGTELKYYAVEDTVINAGEEVGRVLVEAEESGAAYNVGAGRITVSMIFLNGVSGVTNEEGWLYEEGADVEGVEVFRNRILASWMEISELPIDEKIRNIAMGVSGVVDVQIDSQHPRGQGTTDIIVTGTGGEATAELLAKVEAATSYLQGNYDDFLYKSSTVVRKSVTAIIYIAKGESTEGIEEQAAAVIENAWSLSNRTELNCIYLDDMRYALKNKIPSYKGMIFLSPAEDIEYSKDTVVMLDEVSLTVLNKGGD